MRCGACLTNSVQGEKSALNYSPTVLKSWTSSEPDGRDLSRLCSRLNLGFLRQFCGTREGAAAECLNSLAIKSSGWQLQSQE